MKFKVLLSGSNELIVNQFFMYMDMSFICLYSSDHYDDLVNHLKYVNPDVFVYCMQNEDPDTLKRVGKFEEDLKEKNIPMVAIGNQDECDQFFRIWPMLKADVLHRPISSQDIESNIRRMLQKRKMQDAEKECRELERNKAVSVPEERGDGDSIVAAMKLLKKIDKETGVEKSAVVQKHIADAANAGNAVSGGKELKRSHILVVDDDRNVLKLLKEYLSPNYDVATALNGKLALKFLASRTTDLVLLDYEMPMETGAEVLEKLRMDERTKNLPVVFLTGICQKDKIREVLAMNPQGYLLKPIDLERLSSTIQGILR